MRNGEKLANARKTRARHVAYTLCGALVAAAYLVAAAASYASPAAFCFVRNEELAFFSYETIPSIHIDSCVFLAESRNRYPSVSPNMAAVAPGPVAGLVAGMAAVAVVPRIHELTAAQCAGCWDKTCLTKSQNKIITAVKKEKFLGFVDAEAKLTNRQVHHLTTENFKNYSQTLRTSCRIASAPSPMLGGDVNDYLIHSYVSDAETAIQQAQTATNILIQGGANPVPHWTEVLINAPFVGDGCSIIAARSTVIFWEKILQKICDIDNFMAEIILETAESHWVDKIKANPLCQGETRSGRAALTEVFSQLMDQTSTYADKQIAIMDNVDNDIALMIFEAEDPTIKL